MSLGILVHHQDPEKTALLKTRKAGKKFVAEVSFHVGKGGWLTFTSHKFDDEDQAEKAGLEIVDEVQKIGVLGFIEKEQGGDRTHD